MIPKYELADVKKKGKTIKWPRKFKEWHFQKKPENRQRDLFTLKQSTCKGISPLTVGFIVKVKDPYSKVFFQPDLGKSVKSPHQLGHLRIFNHTYKVDKDEWDRNGFKIMWGRFTVLHKDKEHWHYINFKVRIRKNDAKPGELITNFYRTKAAGMTAGGRGGLDVAFCVSTGRSIKKVKWIFEKGKGQQDRELATHYIYKKGKRERKGSVTVWDYEREHKTREFSVIMAGL